MRSSPLPAIALLLLLQAAPPVAAADFPPGRARFSPGQDLETEIVGFIGSAIRSVYVFSERIESAAVVEQMVRTRNLTAVPVRLVTPVDGLPADLMQRLTDGRVEFTTAGASAGFDGTWIVVDGQRTLLCPTGLAYAPLHTDRNFTLVLDHHLLAENYINEFNEMFLNNAYGAGSPAGLAYPNLEVPPAFVETFFAPENDPSARVGALVDLARASIRLSCRGFGSAALGAKFKAKRLEGVSVSVVVDEAPAAAQALHDEMKRAGVDLWRKEYSLDLARVRENTLVIDDRYVCLLPPSLPAGTALTRDGACPVIDSTATAGLFGPRHDALVARILAGVSLRGQVRDGATGEPLPDAKLTVVGTSTVAWTDKYGLYSLRNLATGEVTLEVEKAGYFTIERRLATPGGRVDFAMRGIADAGALRGAVAESVTKRPLANIVLASLFVEPGSGIRTVVRTRSGPSGAFLFEKLPAGQARVTAETTDWLQVGEAVAVVRKGGIVDLETPLLLKPRFTITAMPNPIYPQVIFVTVKSHAPLTRLPEVSVTQKDYLTFPLQMREVASDTLETGLYAGSYRLVHGYFGTAVIDVNRGEAKGSFEIGFIEAGSRYTFRAPARAEFALEASAGAGIVTAFPLSAAPGRPELEPESAEAVDLALPPGCRLGAGSSVAFPDPGEGGLVYRRGSSGWAPVETLRRDGSLVGRVEGAGAYAAFRDRTPPAIRFEPGGARVDDAGSGVDPSSIAAFRDGATLEVAVRAAGEGFRLIPRDGSGSPFEILARDRAGNAARAAGSVPRAAAAPGAAELTVAPNPVTGRALEAELRLPAPAAALFRVYDAAGRRIHAPAATSTLALHRFAWDLRDRRGREVANGAYVLVALDAATGRTLARTRFAVLR